MLILLSLFRMSLIFFMLFMISDIAALSMLYNKIRYINIQPSLYVDLEEIAKFPAIIYTSPTSLILHTGIHTIFIKSYYKMFSAPAVTVGETEGATDSASVLFFTSFFAYNFARK